MDNDSLMKKTCNCGGVMAIHMHTLVYNMKVKISHVPVYSCRECRSYEPLAFIKKDLAKLVSDLGRVSRRKQLSFADRNEWANVLKETFAGFTADNLSDLEQAIRHAIQGRIDLLLDIYRYAVDSADLQWMEEIGLRLSQLTFQPARSVN